MSHGKINFGEYLFKLRTTNGYSQKKVADRLGIDISLLSKIEHGERQVQGHMLKDLAQLFNLSYKELQIQFLNQKIVQEFGDEPYFEDSLMKILKLKNVI